MASEHEEGIGCECGCGCLQEFECHDPDCEQDCGGCHCEDYGCDCDDEE